MVCVAGSVGGCFLSFREWWTDVLQPRGSVESVVLDFLVGILCNWWQRRATQGSVLKFRGRVIVGESGYEKGA